MQPRQVLVTKGSSVQKLILISCGRCGLLKNRQAHSHTLYNLYNVTFGCWCCRSFWKSVNRNSVKKTHAAFSRKVDAFEAKTAVWAAQIIHILVPLIARWMGTEKPLHKVHLVQWTPWFALCRCEVTSKSVYNRPSSQGIGKPWNPMKYIEIPWNTVRECQMPVAQKGLCFPTRTLPIFLGGLLRWGTYHIYSSMYVCMYVCVYIYIYIHTDNIEVWATLSD